MPRCPRCRKDWPAGHRVCPDDGTSLSMATDPTQHHSSSGVAAAAPASEPGAADLPPGMQVGEYRLEGKLG
jgi:hypothetical protein